jgi:hypothetical protein
MICVGKSHAKFSRNLCSLVGGAKDPERRQWYVLRNHPHFCKGVLLWEPGLSKSDQLLYLSQKFLRSFPSATERLFDRFVRT